MERGSSPRSPYFDDLRRMTLPPQALLIRRMEGLVFSTLGELRAQRRLGRARPRVPRRTARRPRALGELDAEFWGDRRPLALAA